jgi:hypothetical protein
VTLFDDDLIDSEFRELDPERDLYAAWAPAQYVDRDGSLRRDADDHDRRFCDECDGHLPLSAFHPEDSVCRDCVEQASTNRRKLIARLRRYSLTLRRYEEMLCQQGGRCAVCRETEQTDDDLFIDHCHETDTVRALLCHGCNASLGLLKEDAARIRALADYAERWNR